MFTYLLTSLGWIMRIGTPKDILNGELNCLRQTTTGLPLLLFSDVCWRHLTVMDIDASTLEEAAVSEPGARSPAGNGSCLPVSGELEVKTRQMVGVRQPRTQEEHGKNFFQFYQGAIRKTSSTNVKDQNMQTVKQQQQQQQQQQ